MHHSNWIGATIVLLAVSVFLTAADPAELTPQQRTALEKKAAELDGKVEQFYQAGQYPRATELARQSLKLRQQLYPKDKYAEGHPDLARSLNNLGMLLQAQGEYAKSEPFYRDALKMRQQFYPRFKYPQGHPDLAESLNNLGVLLRAQGEYAKAEPLLRDALKMKLQLYPKEKYPQGHPDLATSFNNLAVLLQAQGEYAKAEPFFRDALKMRQQLYPRDKYAQGHPDLAQSLNNLGLLLQAQGEYAKAEPFYRDALKMYQQLYPIDKYPQGHPRLADSLNNLGFLLHAQGEYAKAEPFFRDALKMNQQLYPKDKYPQGHPRLAVSLDNLGSLLQAQGEYGKAEPFFRDALTMRQQLYPKDQYPQGHLYLVTSLNNLGLLLNAKEEYAKAEPFFRDALTMLQQLYPIDQYPQGHSYLALSLNNLGGLHRDHGEYAKAEPFFRHALTMLQQLYPKDKYPQGHPHVAASLNNLGRLLQDQGEYAKAEPFHRDALGMQQAHFLRLADLVAEAEALNFAAAQGLTLDGFLSTIRRLPDSPQVYPFVWQAKGALARIQQRRHLDLVASRDPDSQRLGRELLETRQRLARLLLSAPRDPAAHARAVREATDAKEDLEKRLVRQLRLTQPAAALQSGPDQLRDGLPADSAFVDLLRYTDFSQDPRVPGIKGQERRLRYVAFVVRSGQDAVRVELGEAAPIEQAWTAWHAALTGGVSRSGDRATTYEAPAALARLVWQPLRAHLPQKVRTVWLAPDAALCRVPWPALPGSGRDTVLLEEHAVAVVPHGAYLLERLGAKRAVPPPSSSPSRGGGLGWGGTLLAVGGVAYDQAPGAVAKDEVALRAPAVGDKQVRWTALPGTERERQQIVALARKALAREPLERSSAAANTGQLLADLPQARYAHFATHGFFADPKFRSAFQLEEKQFGQLRRERTAAGARSPLVLSGLVLAGANRAETPDRGILTAEAIVGLRLDDLELAVLSACETGLGEVAGNEGVFGLQRAFHIAGTKNVIASLWKVDDDATAALMALFYRNLWIDHQEPLEALRQAQLYLYRHPEQIAALANVRGVDFTEKELPKAVVGVPATGDRTHAGKWAAFVLSGEGK